MRIAASALLFALGAAAGVGCVKGMDALNQNKYQVKKMMNDALDSVTR